MSSQLNGNVKKSLEIWLGKKANQIYQDYSARLANVCCGFRDLSSNHILDLCQWLLSADPPVKMHLNP